MELADLHSSLNPKLEDIAGLDDIIKVHYSYYRYDRYGDSTKHTDVELTWGEIFSAIAPQLSRPVTPPVLESALERWINEKKHNAQSIDVKSTDMDVIKIQLIAMGLIKSYTAPATTGGVSEWLQLTEVGERTMLELLAIRRTRKQEANKID